MKTLRVLPLFSTVQKSLGLLAFKKAIPVIIKTRFGIHTFGMKYPIDVCILSNNHRIVAMKKNLMPNRIYVWNPLFDKVIELPGGTLTKMDMHIGEKISLQLTTL